MHAHAHTHARTHLEQVLAGAKTPFIGAVHNSAHQTQQQQEQEQEGHEPAGSGTQDDGSQGDAHVHHAGSSSSGGSKQCNHGACHRSGKGEGEGILASASEEGTRVEAEAGTNKRNDEASRKRRRGKR